MLIHVRSAEAHDEAFIVEMAREASVIEDRPLPAADSAVVRAVLPQDVKAAVIGEDPDGTRLGAGWWHCPRLAHDESPRLRAPRGRKASSGIVTMRPWNRDAMPR